MARPSWQTIYNRFSRWAKRGVWLRIFRELAIEVDETGSLLDATIVLAHPDAAGGRRGVYEMIWALSRGDVPNKIHAVTMTRSTPLYVTLPQMHRHESIKSEELIAHRDRQGVHRRLTRRSLELTGVGAVREPCGGVTSVDEVHRPADRVIE